MTAGYLSLSFLTTSSMKDNLLNRRVINHTHKTMAILSGQASGGMSPAIVYGVVGVVAAILVIVVAACLINRQRKIRKRARQRLNNARQWELTNFAPRRNTLDNTSISSRQARQQPSAPHSGTSLYRDRPLPPVPIRTRSRPPNRTSTSTPPLHPLSTRIPAAAAAILLDQGTTSDGSAMDIEPAHPVLNEAYARQRMEHHARFAQLGYSESEAILASETGLLSDAGVDAERGRPQDAGKTRERVVQKVAPKARQQSASATPARWVGAGVNDVNDASERTSTPTRPRSQSRGEPSQATSRHAAPHLSPPPRRGVTNIPHPHTAEPGRSRSRARLTEPFQDTNPYDAPAQHGLPAWTIEPPTPTRTSASASNATPKPSSPPPYDDVPFEESVDSSRFSQLDLGTSTEDGTYVSTDISDDPWREEVRANQRGAL